MSIHEYTRVFSLYGVEASLISNEQSLILDDEYFKGKETQLHSLLSNFLKLDEGEYGGKHDYSLYLFQKDNAPFDFSIGDNTAYFSGDLLNENTVQKDKRSTIFGNMGVFSKIFVGALERKGIFSFHSTSFYDPAKNRLYIVLGGSGSGKSTVLLAAIGKGFQVFGTELTHFSVVNGKTKFLKGSMYQNCRAGNLIEDFPELIEKFSLEGKLPEKEIWDNYHSVDFKEIAVKEDIIDDPEVVIMFPRIESDRKNAVFSRKDKSGIVKPIFGSLSEKISEPSWVYGKYLVPSIDTHEMIERRKRAAETFCRDTNIVNTWAVLAGPRECLDEVIKD